MKRSAVCRREMRPVYIHCWTLVKVTGETLRWCPCWARECPPLQRVLPQGHSQPQDLEVIGRFKSTRRVCQLVSLSHQNVLMLQPNPWGGDSSIVPS